MLYKKTPVIMNVDKFLSKKDFRRSLTNNSVWPWPLTHFIPRDTCYVCRTKVDQSLQHFIVTLDKTKRAALLEEPHFWCKRCSYCVYDHYTPEECDHCWLQQSRREDECSTNEHKTLPNECQKTADFSYKDMAC